MKTRLRPKMRQINLKTVQNYANMHTYENCKAIATDMLI